MLKRKGDDVRIDWGYLYLASNKDNSSKTRVLRLDNALNSFNQRGSINDNSETSENNLVTEKNPFVLAYSSNFTQAKNFIMLAYDDVKSIKVFDYALTA